MKKHTNFLSYTVVPLLLIITGTAIYLAIKEAWNKELMIYGIFLFTFLYIQLFERIIPLKKNWAYNTSGLLTDLKHLIFSAAIFDALAKAAAIAFILFVHQFLSIEIVFWDNFHFIVSFIVANIIGELLPYLYHRVSHKGNVNSALSMFLWKTHAIHHLPTTMNWFKTNWIHPFNIFLNTFLKVSPLLLLGFSQDIIFAVAVTHVIIAYLSHANIKAKTGVLDYLIVTPQVHHFHHSKKFDEAKNYGSIIPFWDLIFGTFYNRKGEVEEIGVIENADISYPANESYLTQLTFPLNRKNCCSSSHSNLQQTGRSSTGNQGIRN